MVKPELTLLEVQVERVVADAVELRQASLGEAPEALNAVDVSPAVYELVLPMLHPEVLLITDVDQTVIASPPVRMDHHRRFDSAWNYSQKRLPGTIKARGFRRDLARSPCIPAHRV